MQSYPLIVQQPQIVVAAPAIVEEKPVKKQATTHREIIEEAGLAHPQESTHFLEYLKNHVEKVDSHASRIGTISKFFLLAAGACLAYQAVAFFSENAKQATYSGRAHKLGAGNTSDVDIQSTFSGLSCMIWGLVLTKARNGMNAASTKDSSTVSQVVSRTGQLILLIIGATACQYIANFQTSVEFTEPASHPALKQAHQLKAASPIVEDRPESFYDVNSSHYMGGAHNAALKTLDQAKQSKPALKVPSQASMGGAHNSAMNAVAL